MGRTTRNTLDNAMLGALAGTSARMTYDSYNNRKMRKDYHEENIIPEEKSMGKVMLLTFFLGSIGLMSVSPRMATFLFFFEAALFLGVIMPFIFIVAIPLIFLMRLFILFIAYVSTISYNNTRIVLFRHFDNVL